MTRAIGTGAHASIAFSSSRIDSPASNASSAPDEQPSGRWTPRGCSLTDATLIVLAPAPGHAQGAGVGSGAGVAAGLGDAGHGRDGQHDAGDDQRGGGGDLGDAVVLEMAPVQHELDADEAMAISTRNSGVNMCRSSTRVSSLPPW